MLVGRTERRGAVNFEGRLVSAGVPSYSELVRVKDISLHGARVVSPRPLPEQSRVELIAAIGDFRVAAEVIYCQPLAGHACAIGLWFPVGVADD